MSKVILDNGKYVFSHQHGVGLTCARHGVSNWRDFAGDGAVLALVQEVEALREKLAEVHSWIVCAPIAPPDDMMQNAERIIEITRP